MASKKQSGQYWAVEFAGDQVRLCGFEVEGERVAVHRCESRPAADFDFAHFRDENGWDRSGSARILCAVPRSEVLLKPFDTVRSEQIDLEKVTALKLEQSLGGLDANATMWGFIENGVTEDGKRAHVLAAAIPRPYVEGLIQKHFPNAGRPQTLECGALSAVRAHVANRQQAPRCELVVDCAPDGFSLFVLHEGVIESAHFIPGNRTFESVAMEIRRLVAFGTTKRDSVPVESVTCLGGDVAQRLSDDLRGAFDIPITARLGTVPQWIQNTDMLPADWVTDWHRVVGLMAIAQAHQPAAINFLAAEAPRRQVHPLVAAVTQLRTPVLAVLLVGLVAGVFLMHGVMARRRDTIMDLVIERGQQITTDLQRNEQALSILKKYGIERFSLMKILTEIAEVAPQGVTLDSLTLNPDGSLTLQGRCQGMSEGQEFVRKLNASPTFVKAEAPSLRKDQRGIAFKMTCSLEPRIRKASK